MLAQEGKGTVTVPGPKMNRYLWGAEQITYISKYKAFMGDSQFLYMHVPVNIFPDNTPWFIPFQIHTTPL